MDTNTSNQSQPDSPFVDCFEGAALVCISHWTLRSWLTQKRLRRFKIGGRTLVDRNELLALVKPAEGKE